MAIPKSYHTKSGRDLLVMPGYIRMGRKEVIKGQHLDDVTIFDALIFADLVNILTPLQCIFLALEPSPVYSRDGIKGLILRHFSKLKSTHPGKLRQPQIMHCGSRNAQDGMFISCIAARALRQCYLQKNDPYLN